MSINIPTPVSVVDGGWTLDRTSPPAPLSYTHITDAEALILNRRNRGSFGCYAGLAFVAGFAVACAWYL